MIDKIQKLISDLQEDAEWAHTNEWETPITFGDHLEAAAEMIESLCVELEKEQEMRQHADEVATVFIIENEKLKREKDALLKELRGDCGICARLDECRNDKFSLECNFDLCWQWRGLKEGFDD